MWYFVNKTKNQIVYSTIHKQYLTTISSVHSFIHSGHFYSASWSPLLLRSAPDTERILCWSFMPKRQGQLWV